LLFNKLISLSAKRGIALSQKERFSLLRKETTTLSHEIFELLLQLRVLVVDAPHDCMLEGTTKPSQINTEA
jgi:hypothetical protein